MHLDYQASELFLHRTAICLITLLAMVLNYVNTHPICLTFGPPYAVTGGLDFCSDYSLFGCCSRDDDAGLQARYNSYIAAYPSSSCAGTLKALLCLQCSPYAVHLYDAETLSVRKDFPGVCAPLCSYIYENCSSIISYVTNGSAQVQAYVQAGEYSFCSYARISDMTYCYPDLINNSALNQVLQHQQTTQPGCLCLDKFASNLRNALILTYPDDGSGRILVGEQLGLVSVYYKNGSRLNNLFMDISSLVLTSSSAGDERGFLGMACHPQFAANQKLYVYFSLSHAGRLWNRVAEFQTSSADRNTVDILSERVIFEIEKPFDNHNGGEMLFGPDGYLYITTGDGGAGGDPYGNGQNLSALLGKVLRIDVDARTVNGSYGIPPSNPFINVTRARPEIFAYGVRNMWRCSFDRGDFQTGAGKGRLFCGDVGQSAWEEVDIIKSGLNYGWNSREGFACYTASTCGHIGPEELPIYAYDHSVGQSVTGGYVYRGCQYPNLNGRYIYGDYQNGRIFMLTDVNQSIWNNTEILMCASNLCTNGLVNRYEQHILSFGEDFDGDIYMLTTSNPSPTSFTGSIYRLVDPSRQSDPALCRPTVSTTSTPSAPTTSITSTTTAPLSTIAATTTTTPIATTTKTIVASPTSASTSMGTSTATFNGISTSTSMGTSTATSIGTSTATSMGTSTSPAAVTYSTVSTTTTPQTTTTTTTTVPTTIPTVISVPGHLWSCNFELTNGSPIWCGMIQATDDNFDWTIYSLPTPSDPTGPDVAFNGPYYIYIEASLPRKANDTAKLYLPSLNGLPSVNDFSQLNTYCLSFNYHMFGFHIRELQLFVETTDTNGNRIQSTIWRSTNEKGNFWLFAAVTINVPGDKNVTNQIGFVGVRGNEYSGDIGLDHITLVSGSCS